MFQESVSDSRLHQAQGGDREDSQDCLSSWSTSPGIIQDHPSSGQEASNINSLKASD